MMYLRPRPAGLPGLHFFHGLCGFFRPAVAPLLFLSFAAGPLHAALDFNTYAIVKNTVRVIRDGKPQDSSYTTYELTRLGSTSLEASSITITSHGSYLAVVEEATLTGNVEDRPRDITQDFLFQGSLPVPPLAAVHYLGVLHGDTLFKASLRKSVYSLNDTFFDTTALGATLDSRLAFLQQLSDRSFEATFTRLSLGEPLRVRIAYDLPFPGAPGAEITVPVLFHPSGTPPRQSQISFFETAGDLPPVQWLGPNGRVTLNHAGTHTVAYQSGFSFRRDEKARTVSTLQATTFESGKFKGNYLLFKGGLDDSLMNQLSRPLEVSFLWRWNPPYAFVETRNGLKTLSNLGLQAIQEARGLKQIIQEFAPRGHRFGLLRSAPGYEDNYFPPAEKGTGGYDSLLAWLDGFNEQRIYAEYKDYKEGTPDWVVKAWGDSGEIVKSRNGFLDALKRIHGGFSGRPEVLRHIAMLGLGSAPASMIDLKDPQVVEDIIDSVTLSNVFAPWLGVDFKEVLKLKANDNLRPVTVSSSQMAGLPPLMLPVFQPTSIEYRAFTVSRSHAVVMPFSRTAERQAMIKAAEAFGDTLQLQGIDALGRKTRIITLSPRMIRTESDSGMARLWAADPDRIAEVSEVDLGMRYGILTKGTYWSAWVGDGKVVPFGTDPFGTPILPKVVRAPNRETFRIEGGILRIADPMAARRLGDAPVLEVYDLRGRLILSLSLATFRKDGGFSVPMDVLKRLGQGRLYLVLRGADRAIPFTLALGGMR